MWQEASTVAYDIFHRSFWANGLNLCLLSLLPLTVALSLERWRKMPADVSPPPYTSFPWGHNIKACGLFVEAQVENKARDTKQLYTQQV